MGFSIEFFALYLLVILVALAFLCIAFLFGFVMSKLLVALFNRILKDTDFSERSENENDTEREDNDYDE